MTVTPDRNPMPAAETTWLTTVVRNVGDQVVTWSVDGCGIDVSVFGTVGARFRSGDATGISEELTEHRAWLLDAIDRGDGTTASIDFLTDTLVNMQDIGCADVGIPRRLDPGEAVRARLRWDGWSWRGQIPQPSGPIELTIRFRHGTGQAAKWRTIETSLPAWITNGLDAALLSPAEAVDAALDDAEFTEWLARQPLRDGADTRLGFDAELERWVVGLQRYNPVPGWCVARIDARTGSITAIEGSGGTLTATPPCPVR